MDCFHCYSSFFWLLFLNAVLLIACWNLPFISAASIRATSRIALEEDHAPPPRQEVTERTTLWERERVSSLTSFPDIVELNGLQDLYLQSEFLPNVEYQLTIEGRLENIPVSAGGTAEDVFEIALVTKDDDANATIRSSTIVLSGTLTEDWQRFQGVFVLPQEEEEIVAATKSTSSPPTSFHIQVHGPIAGHDFSLDDTLLQDMPPVAIPYTVDATDNTEQVTIPSPPEPVFRTTLVDCPHENPGLVPWETLFPLEQLRQRQGEPLILPLETSVLLTHSVPVQLGLLTIPIGSQLVIGPPSVNDVYEATGRTIRLDVEGMDVQGDLIVGSESCPFGDQDGHQLIVTLHGDRPVNANTEKQLTTQKGISVTGLLELHGKRYYRTWTRLASRATPGDSVLYLQDTVNWQVGQEIVLITTAMHDTRDWHENEVFTIEQIDTIDLPFPEAKAMVRLSSPVQHSHIARHEYQAEVGLLSRSIIIQGGEADSPPTDASKKTCRLRDHRGQAVELAGYSQVTCPDSYLTGYGGHVMVHNGGRGYVEGVELYRMGQTNVMGRYPMHFHLLRDDCPGCYFKHSSIHESYYRCISIHATNGVTVSENVGFDITGFCYYLEDAVEERNTISYNLAAHIHVIGTPAIGQAQDLDVIHASPNLILPADAAASGYYISNVHNTVIGNVASGGWAGFAFPNFDKPIGPTASEFPDDYRPASRPVLELDGNTAHSTAPFWSAAAAFYFGGTLYRDKITDELVYNAGRDRDIKKTPCVDDENSNKCVPSWNRITNTKVYQVQNVGIGSWTGRMEVVNYEAHDIGMSMEALERGFWIDNMTVACRTGEALALPTQRADLVPADGFYWYDTNQLHVITNSKFRNCGYRSPKYEQYDTSPSRGCADGSYNGCSWRSTVFGLVSHSDFHNPEVMQATRNISYTDVGRRFRMTVSYTDTVSGRLQNWMDVDGSVSGLRDGPVLIGSGLKATGKWWHVDSEVVYDGQGPLNFVPKDHVSRGLGHMRLLWDKSLHDTVGVTSCFNGKGPPGSCKAVGRIRHLGRPYSIDQDSTGGLPVTANPDISGLVGGYGWLLSLDRGAPRVLNITQVEVNPETPLILSIQYPKDTTFTVKAYASKYCKPTCDWSCEETFRRVHSVDDVRHGIGNNYHFDDDTGLLTIRVTMLPFSHVGTPNWRLFDYDDPGRNGGYALRRFERDGILLPEKSSITTLSITAACRHDGTYCINSVPQSDSIDDVCSHSGRVQTSFDRCCSSYDPLDCEFAYDGERQKQAELWIPKVADTVLSESIIDNAGFGEYNLCSWIRHGSKAFDMVLIPSGLQDPTSNGVAVQVADRVRTYDSPRQNVLRSFKSNTVYNVETRVRFPGDGGSTVGDIQLVLRVEYETSKQWFTLVSMKSLESGAWYELRDTFYLPRSEMKDEVVSNMEVYFQTPGSTASFDVDRIDMAPIRF